ncbi:MAG: hypothetical protein WAX79_02550, partial [Candidatus Omnitrophota bacterium]
MTKYFIQSFWALLLGVTLVLNCAYAQEEQKLESLQDQAKIGQEERTLKGIEVLTGFCWNKLKAKTDFDKKPDYNFYPLIVDFDFNLKNLTKKIGFNPAGLV